MCKSDNNNIINDVNIIINVKRNLKQKGTFCIRFGTIIIFLIMQEYKST